ncbi:hypothetical protein MRB53_021751 [Persea americana]|uniref:Uncharacterized protein n=1 Tax=Persea americana TaxID=3435 RepID=A0ACC2L4U7_PERAE|nr:hypothetical protein MRB53_021751 [Persea americana]
MGEIACERTSAVVDAKKIYGWDDQVKEITEILTKENKGGLNVVGIVGMFGTGKTALAQKIFASERVMKHFAVKLWVWVSPNCKKETLILRMLDNLGVDEEHIQNMLNISPTLDNVGVLLFLLYLQLRRKRHVIVFDDIANVKDWHCELEKRPPDVADQEWSDRLAYGLPKGEGSAIIVTGRTELDIRKMVGNGGIRTPKPLLEEPAWELFKSSYEEAATKPLSDKTLELFKNEIVRKCYGLPEAFKAAGRGMGRMALVESKNGHQVNEQA